MQSVILTRTDSKHKTPLAKAIGTSTTHLEVTSKNKNQKSLLVIQKSFFLLKSRKT